MGRNPMSPHTIKEILRLFFYRENYPFKVYQCIDLFLLGHADIERTEGAKLEEDWRANVGVRFAF